jgi:hypothetical protein
MLTGAVAASSTAHCQKESISGDVRVSSVRSICITYGEHPKKAPAFNRKLALGAS